MGYMIRMGIPEMQELWDNLQQMYRAGTINKNDEILYKKWGNALKKLAADPFYPSLQTHEIPPLSKRYGMKVWQSYLENKKSDAMRMFWVYGPGQSEITIIGLEPHPEDKKNGAYDRIKLSELTSLYEPDKVAKAGFHVAKSEYMVKKRRERNGFPSFLRIIFSKFRVWLFCDV